MSRTIRTHTHDMCNMHPIVRSVLQAIRVRQFCAVCHAPPATWPATHAGHHAARHLRGLGGIPTNQPKEPPTVARPRASGEKGSDPPMTGACRAAHQYSSKYDPHHSSPGNCHRPFGMLAPRATVANEAHATLTARRWRTTSPGKPSRRSPPPTWRSPR